MILLNKNLEADNDGKSKVVVHRCALKHGLTERDIRHAWRMAIAVRDRTSDPSHKAAAGPDRKGRMVELLAFEREDGAIVVYHAMRLTRKMADELDLG